MQPYNWHWFRIWGTGETLNNGTHEVDVCRWALDVDYPKRISASGGRYAYKDDWQFYDTLNIGFEFDDKAIAWECTCCNDMRHFNGRGRGSIIEGTNGTVLVDRDGYEIYDLKGKKINEFKVGGETSTEDLVGRDSMTDCALCQLHRRHPQRRKTQRPSVHRQRGSDHAADGQRGVGWSGTTCKINPANCMAVNDPEAMRLWSREYEKGWEPKV